MHIHPDDAMLFTFQKIAVNFIKISEHYGF